ncbi:FtsX-like permease family protein [Granulicella sp. WH15]|uniref:ABC transporter permease n=1 Tax=Granulicella sp. WH15 TaxID=2602070 RepID=UPI0013673365|nr:ABC transporter permease [Granulicella sp. WH15]QHN02878.1 FtsX-like permease family protein [Granulicella sp. WH15]
MQVGQSWKIALSALKKNKLQTALTMVGMTIGVATVLTMISVGTGAQAAIHDQVLAAGMNLLVIHAGNFETKEDMGDGADGGVVPAAYDPVVDRPALVRVQSDGVAEDPNEDFKHKRGYQRPGDLMPGRGAAHTLTLADAEMLRRIRGVQYVSSGVRDSTMVANGETKHFAALHGDDVMEERIRRAWRFPFGRFFTKAEEEKGENVVVLGAYASEQLFGLDDPVGKRVTIKGESFKVVGVISSGSWMMVPAEGDDQFDAVYVPVTTLQRMLQRPYLSTISVTTASSGDVTRVLKLVQQTLRRRHGIGEEMADDFIVVSEARKALSLGVKPNMVSVVTGNVNGLERVTLDQLGKTLDEASSTMTALLTSIAAVSLVVGGIGVMNIMLLSVTQRTREIGIRRAVGAKAEDVLAQFLLEAMTLSLVGGMIGIALGCAASVYLTRAVQWSTKISGAAILLSFGISAAIGIFFGYYPALQASQLTPIDALGAE